MTEAEAREKWCPMTGPIVAACITATSTHVELAKKVSELMGKSGAKLCIGSACMMWRTSGPLIDPAALLAMSPVNRDAYIANAPIGGYCGLAGKL